MRKIPRIEDPDFIVVVDVDAEVDVKIQELGSA